MFCPNCGQSIVPGEKFCSSCGAKIAVDDNKSIDSGKHKGDTNQTIDIPQKAENGGKEKININELIISFVIKTLFVGVIFFVASHIFGRVPIIHIRGPLTFFDSCLYGALGVAVYTVGDYLFKEK